MSTVYTKITWHMKIQEKITQPQEKSQSIDANPKIIQMIELAGRTLKQKLQLCTVK